MGLLESMKEKDTGILNVEKAKKIGLIDVDLDR